MNFIEAGDIPEGYTYFECRLDSNKKSDSIDIWKDGLIAIRNSTNTGGHKAIQADLPMVNKNDGNSKYFTRSILK